MFQSKPLGTYVPSKSVNVFPESRIDYGPNTEARFNIPSYLGFMNPRGSYLQMEITLQGRGYYRPEHSAHAFIQHMRIQGGSALAVLEEIDDYNAYVANIAEFTENDSIRHKRELNLHSTHPFHSHAGSFVETNGGAGF